MSTRLDLDAISKQMGFKASTTRKPVNTSEVPAETTAGLETIEAEPLNDRQIMTASIIDQDEDSQPTEKRPLLRSLLVAGAMASTVGVGVIAMLWDGGGDRQQAKNPKTDEAQTSAQIEAASDKDKEVAELKAKVAMQQQKEDAARAKAAMASTSQPSPSPATTPPPATAAKPATVAAVPLKPSPELVALRQSREQEAAQLAALKSSVQQERENLAVLRRQRNIIGSGVNPRRAAIAARPIDRIQPVIPVRPVKIASRNITPGQIIPPKLIDWERAASLGSYGGTTDVRAKANERAVQVASQRAIAPAGTLPVASWEQAAGMSNYGGTVPISPGTANNPNSNRVVEVVDSGATMSPMLRLPVGEVVPAKLVTPFYTLIGSNETQPATEKSLVSVVLEKSIEVGTGWHLPAGAAIEFDFQVADNGMIKAISKKVTYKDTTIDIPQGAFAITNNDSQPLMAEVREVNGDKLAAADRNAAIWGAAGEVGKVLVESGNQSTISTGIGTTISTTNNQNPNVLAAVMKGAFTPVAQQQVDRGKALANKLDKQSKVGFLTPGTNLKVYVAQAATFQVPMNNATQAALGSPLRTPQTVVPSIVPAQPVGIAPLPTPTQTGVVVPAQLPLPPTTVWTQVNGVAPTAGWTRTGVSLQPMAPAKGELEVKPVPATPIQPEDGLKTSPVIPASIWPD
jgi:hypothetical protein